MNKRIISLMAAALALLSAGGQQVTFSGYEEGLVPIEVDPEMSTGLNKIYVVYDTQGVEMTFNSPVRKPAKWTSYNIRDGQLFFEDIRGVGWDGGYNTTLSRVLPNTGYQIEVEGASTFRFWVVNYVDYMMELNDMFYTNDRPCDMLHFRVDGVAPRIRYVPADGHAHTLVLDRQIELMYKTMERESDEWEKTTVVETFESLEEDITIQQPLCNTAFKLTGDRFLKQWGRSETIEIESGDTFYTKAVACASTAVQEKRHSEVDNDEGEDEGQEEEEEESSLGGSAPFTIVFTGYPTEAVVYRAWEMATDLDFEDIIRQDYVDVMEYTFQDAGTYYVRYKVANAEGSCEAYGDVYTIGVNESELKDCPNVFSPGTTPGVNDRWKVSYKSLLEFHCWIFNRWGTLIYESTDPDEGWDGTYHGRLVDTGVYYYVVTAVGNDGQKYKKRGDINILNYKKGAEGTSNPTEGGGY